MFFFFNDTATTEIYTLSLHDALPIFDTVPPTTAIEPIVEDGVVRNAQPTILGADNKAAVAVMLDAARRLVRSEEHTSELQSRQYLVCRLLLEKKNKPNHFTNYYIYTN